MRQKSSEVCEDELIYASATTLAQAICNREVSSLEVVTAYLQRLQSVNPKLNAVVQLTAEVALKQAQRADEALAQGKIKGPLHGVPMTVKDILETAGVVTTAGTKGCAFHIPKSDATVVARMYAAGAILLGKTNVPELASSFVAETDNLLYGRTNNPYDLSRTPGGSSGGEAAIIAAGGSPLGIGDDLGGSLRIPAHCCGIAAIKPTTGRVPSTGMFPPPTIPVAHKACMLQTGPMARFVKDLILTLPIISGVDWRDPNTIPMPLFTPDAVNLKNLRVAFYTDNGVISPTPETVKMVQTTAQLLADASVVVEEDRPVDLDQVPDLWLSIFGADGGAGLKTQLQQLGTTEIHPMLLQLIEMLSCRALTTQEFLSLWGKWDLVRGTMLGFLEKYDVILCPVAANPAWSHGKRSDEDNIPSVVSYTVPYSLTGWPSVVVRGGTSPEGLPLGVQVVAHPWHEEVALAVAQYIETVLGGWQRPSI